MQGDREPVLGPSLEPCLWCGLAVPSGRCDVAPAPCELGRSRPPLVLGLLGGSCPCFSFLTVNTQTRQCSADAGNAFHVAIRL